LRRLRLAKRDHRLERRRGQGAPDRADQGFVVHIAGRKAGCAAGRIDKFQRHRLHRHRRFNGRLDEVGVKVPEGDAVAGGAFGEHRQDVARAKAVRHLRDDAVGVAPRLALDVQRAGAVGQRAHKGPAPHIRLGDKTAMARGMHHQDIEPRNMVGHQQHRACSRPRAVDHQLNADDAQHGPGPYLHARLLLSLGQLGEKGLDGPETLHRMHDRTQQGPAKAKPPHRENRPLQCEASGAS
jgi:hypothetical protein